MRLLRNSARPFQVTSLGGRSLSGACVAICGVSFFSFGKKDYKPEFDLSCSHTIQDVRSGACKCAKSIKLTFSDHWTQQELDLRLIKPLREKVEAKVPFGSLSSMDQFERTFLSIGNDLETTQPLTIGFVFESGGRISIKLNGMHADLIQSSLLSECLTEVLLTKV